MTSSLHRSYLMSRKCLDIPYTTSWITSIRGWVDLTVWLWDKWGNLFRLLLLHYFHSVKKHLWLNAYWVLHISLKSCWWHSSESCGGSDQKELKESVLVPGFWPGVAGHGTHQDCKIAVCELRGFRGRTSYVTQVFRLSPHFWHKWCPFNKSKLGLFRNGDI